MAGGKKGKTEAKSKGGPKEAPKGGKGNAKKDNSQPEKKETKVKGAQAIVCDKHSKKEEALEKIRNGTSFAEVAREYSQDKAKSGGSLGKKKKTDLLPEFADVAFALPAIGSTPEKDYSYGEVKTSEGYHIILVEKRE
ncbi:uncharacterized protein JN550_010919 [Neoarthrinium moseri]|uniref:uncharacterized protein n=1 Tax=Neoarthrinium moseri TaxID=1658444 RepID=UPI001FDCA320|nr:uncharacterized protein JN550_010919 [Neoarthrinium moseri]KAI1861389.1 hypothetical protein JN550_010919 [Neoarthrinium moseri]